MQSDLLQILVLASVGLAFILLRDGGGALVFLLALLEGLWIACARAVESFRHTSSNPYKNLALVGLIVLIIGWGKIIALYGIEDVVRTVINPRGSGRVVERDRCLDNQRKVYDHVSRELHEGTRRFAKGRLYLFKPGMECPYKGHYYIDNEGCLSCERHGRNIGLPKLGENKGTP
jgi:hypothetical protein